MRMYFKFFGGSERVLYLARKYYDNAATENIRYNLAWLIGWMGNHLDKMNTDPFEFYLKMLFKWCANFEGVHPPMNQSIGRLWIRLGK